MKFAVALTVLAVAETAFAGSQLEDRSFRFFRNRRPKVNAGKFRTKTVTAPATCDGAAPTATTIFQTVTVDRTGGVAPEVTRTVTITQGGQGGGGGGGGGAQPTAAPPPPPPVEDDEDDGQVIVQPPPQQEPIVTSHLVTVTLTTPVTVTQTLDGTTIVQTQTVTQTTVEQTVETLTQTEFNTVTETTSFGINTNTQAPPTGTEDAGVIETGVPGGDNGGDNGGNNGGDNGGNNGGDNGGNNGGDNGGNNGGDNGGNNGGDNGGNNGGDNGGDNGGNNGGDNGGNGGGEDPQTSLTLDPRVIQPGLASDGQPAGGANDGQVPSLTSTNNFINFCLTQPVPLTDGKQIRTGSCNVVPMGRIIAKDKIPTAKFVNPPNFGTIPANTPFDIVLKVKNFQTGAFTNAQANYYAAPSQVNDQGFVIGHSHVVVELLPDLASTEPLDPTKFAFFKGVNQAADGNGILVTPVTAGLPPGAYRLFSINTAANHQPVLASVAQHGSMDDAVYFTVA